MTRNIVAYAEEYFIGLVKFHTQFYINNKKVTRGEIVILECCEQKLCWLIY